MCSWLSVGWLYHHTALLLGLNLKHILTRRAWLARPDCPSVWSPQRLAHWWPCWWAVPQQPCWPTMSYWFWWSRWPCRLALQSHCQRRSRSCLFKIMMLPNLDENFLPLHIRRFFVLPKNIKRHQSSNCFTTLHFWKPLVKKKKKHVGQKTRQPVNQCPWSNYCVVSIFSRFPATIRIVLSG